MESAYTVMIGTWFGGCDHSWLQLEHIRLVANCAPWNSTSSNMRLRKSSASCCFFAGKRVDQSVSRVSSRHTVLPSSTDLMSSSISCVLAGQGLPS